MTTTFRQLYDNPPAGSPQVGNGGSTDTSAFDPVHPPQATTLPRHIVEDPNLCQHLRAFAQKYLTQLTHTRPAELDVACAAVLHALTILGVGDEGINTALFPGTSTYAIEFVASADQIPLMMFQFRTCDIVDGIRPGTILMQNQHPRLVVKYKGINAFNPHHNAITNLTRALMADREQS